MSSFWFTFCIFMGGYVLGCITSAIAGANADAKRIIEESKK